MFGIQYHDVRARIGAHMEGGSKKRVKNLKKVPKNPKSQLFGGGVLQLVHGPQLGGIGFLEFSPLNSFLGK